MITIQKIDNHSFRREYAKKLYDELVEEKESEGEEIVEDYRGYNKYLILEVSKNLGHEREDVIIESYL